MLGISRGCRGWKCAPTRGTLRGTRRVLLKDCIDRVVLKPYGFNYPNYGVHIYIYTYTYITFLIFRGKQIGS